MDQSRAKAPVEVGAFDFDPFALRCVTNLLYGSEHDISLYLESTKI